MTNKVLYEGDKHKNVLLEDFGLGGLAVQANQHVIVHGNAGMILDPGGHKLYSRALINTINILSGAQLHYIFLSHQDPDIVAAISGWLLATEADAYISQLWVRFVPHFSSDRLLKHRLKGIPDEGMILDLDGSPLLILPAHYLHSCGNFQVFDPVSKILYSGDLGASLGMNYIYVTNFDEHIQYMEGFHQRYMTSNKALKAWADMVRTLDIEIIAPQHGAIFKGKKTVQRFIDWCSELQCGVDIATNMFKVPSAWEVIQASEP